MIFNSYEIHAMSKLNFSDMLEKLKTAGYKYVIKLIPGEEGVKLHIMTNNMAIETMVKMYGEKDGYYIYEVKVKTKDDFVKVHDILAVI